MKKFMLAWLAHTKWILLMLSFMLMAFASAPVPKEDVVWMNNKVSVMDKSFSKVQGNHDMKVNYPGFLFHDPRASYDASLKSQNFMTSAVRELFRKENNGGNFGISRSSLEFTYKVYHQENALVSVMFFNSVYLAGSNRPTTSCLSMNYDFEANKDFGLTDLFLPDTDFETQLSSLLKKRTGCTRLNTERLLKNFGFNEKGLLFTIDDPAQPKVTCTNLSDIQIEWSEIRDLLNTESSIVRRILGR